MKSRVTMGLISALIVGLATICLAEATERVAPPQDQEKMYLSVVGDQADPEYHSLLLWFTTNKDLAALKKSTHFRPVTTRSAIFRERYADNVPGLPCVRLQKPSGAREYESGGDDLPKSAEALLNEIERSTNQILPWRRRIERRSCPEGDCDPTPEIDYQDVPPVFEEPEPEPEPEGISVWVAFLAAFTGSVIGTGIGVFRSVKQESGP